MKTRANANHKQGGTPGRSFIHEHCDLAGSIVSNLTNWAALLDAAGITLIAIEAEDYERLKPVKT